MERKGHKRLKRSYTLEEAISAITDDFNPDLIDFNPVDADTARSKIYWRGAARTF